MSSLLLHTVTTRLERDKAGEVFWQRTVFQ